MHSIKKIHYRYLSKRGLIIYKKKVRRRKKKERKKTVNKQKQVTVKQKTKNKSRRKFIFNKRTISHGSNINHLMSLKDKLNLLKYHSRVSHYTKDLFSRSSALESQKFEVPSVFSLLDSPTESFDFIYALFAALYWQTSKKVIIDYSKCSRIDLDAQVFMDVVLHDFLQYMRKCRKHGRKLKLQQIEPSNFDQDHIVKILFSIGSFKLFTNIRINFENILPYDLCIGNKKMKGSEREVSSQKEIHTTKLLDYVIACLSRMGRKLTPEARSELCQVVGEILINAEEHSTTDNRFSIGFFEETTENDKHYGLFNLVIFNFGMTIYEKFKDPNCPTTHIVSRMKMLSEQYTKRGFFKPSEFEEETLWTLYALQEGITSKVNYQKRGNGSIRFIESFFTLKGTGLLKDDISRLSIHSGNSRIIFDGSYEISSKTIGENNFRIIAFNNTGNIEEKPDKNFVTFVPEYFPGTMITAKIRIGEEDLVKEDVVN